MTHSSTKPARARPRAEALLTIQKCALELLTANAPLGSVLDYLTLAIEREGGDLVCSVLVLEGDRLSVGAAPSLPASYNAAVEGLVIGPSVGSCGTAAYTRKPVVVSDIAHDPLWADYRHIALAHGLRACWSTPIFSRQGAALGTFAIYYTEPGPPRAGDLELVEAATHIAGIAIERHRADQALAARAADVADAARRKDEFLAMLAHELRSPLTPIFIALELLRRFGGDPGEVERSRRMIDRQARHLKRLVDDLLNVARISSGKFDLRMERVPVQPMVELALETTRSLFEQRGHDLTIRVPEGLPDVEVDPARMGQVIANLLGNAAKYTPAGGRIDLDVALEGARLVIRVRDSGVGIPAEMLPRVFDLFVQVDESRSRSDGGLGIGLYLAKQIIELHGGLVAAESEGAGKGSVFTVWLPVASRRALVP